MAEVTRRQLFGRGLGRAARLAAETRGEPGGVDDPPVGASASLVRPAAPRRTLSVAEALDVAAAEGLGHREGDVRRHLRRSVRMTRSRRRDATRSVLWGSAGEASESGRWRGVARIDLAELAAAGVRTGLPAAGVLHADVLDASGDPDEPVEGRRARVTIRNRVDDGAPTVGERSRRAVALTPELTLPRQWYATVGELELDLSEAAAWERTRSRLAELQGSTLFDHHDETVVLHRLLGYPDERRGAMADLCAGPADADAWRLLLQVTLADAPTAARWRDDRERLYLWIRGPEFTRGGLAGVRAFLQ